MNSINVECGWDRVQVHVEDHTDGGKAIVIAQANYDRTGLFVQVKGRDQVEQLMRALAQAASEIFPELKNTLRKDMEMKTTLARAAVVAATRLIRDNNPKARWTSLPLEVREAHISLFDTEADESTPKAKRQLREAAELAGDLVQFGLAVQGGRNV